MKTQAVSRLPAIAVAYSSYSAAAEGAQLVIGNVLQPGFTVTATAGADGSYAITDGTVDLSSEPADGQTWSLTLNDPVSGEQTVSFDVDRLADVVAWLTADINANGPASISAALEGTTMEVEL